MLKEFRVRNFMNFRDELVFSLDNEKNYEFNNRAIEKGIIKNAVIIGYNASGKTNLGAAILDIANHLTDNKKTGLNKGLYTNLNSSDKEAHFTYVFQFEEHTVKYVYDKIDLTTLTRERLWIDGKEIVSQEFGVVKIDLIGAENLDIEKINSNISIVKYVYANTSLNRDDIYADTFVRFVEFVNGMLMTVSAEKRAYTGFSTVDGNMFSLICDLDNGVKELEMFLQRLGINYQLVEVEDEEGKNIYCKFKNKSVKLSSLCSSGTRALVFFFYWYKQREHIRFLYLDEFDAFYHTELSEELMKILMEMNNVQIFVSTHNTDIISNEILRPDCYYILEDNEIKPLYKRTRKALREAHNLQKMYKAGAFNENL